jgi:hypothetical protein
LLRGSKYLGRGGANRLDVWRAWRTNVADTVATAGHYPAEEHPQATLIPFLKARGPSR